MVARALYLLAFTAVWHAVMGITLPATLNPKLISREHQTWQGSEADVADCVPGKKPWLLDGKPYGDRLKPYRSLFAKWDNKDVAFAGDSLIRQVWLTIGCAANLLNGTTETSMLEEVHQTRDGVTLHEIPQPAPWPRNSAGAGPKADKGIAMLHGKMRVSVDKMSFNLHIYFHLESLDQETYHQNYDFAGQETLVILNTALVSTLNKYDLVYLNTAHGGLRNTYKIVGKKQNKKKRKRIGLGIQSEDEAQDKCQDHSKGLIDLIHESKLHATFIEHPPSHFDTDDGDSDEAGSGVCKCQPLKTLAKQFNYQCERGPWMDAYLEDKPTIRTAHYFESMSDLCDRHFGAKKGDCRHFDMDPVLLITLVENMVKLL